MAACLTLGESGYPTGFPFPPRDLQAGNVLLKAEPSCTVGGHAGCCSLFGKEYGGSSKS